MDGPRGKARAGATREADGQDRWEEESLLASGDATSRDNYAEASRESEETSGATGNGTADPARNLRDSPMGREAANAAANGGDGGGGGPPKKPPIVSWSELPHKGQLAAITFIRISEPVVQNSIQSYMYYQLKWFDPTLSPSVISSQAGLLTAGFTAAQFFTAMIWGRLADDDRFGRKTVILIGLTGTLISSIGFGFSVNFWQAFFFRVIAGITNGNVGVLRTMVSEVVKEKKYHSRAFLLLPMSYNIGVIIGPVMGGVLSDPAGSYPNLFGNVQFFKDFPYAPPNLVSALYLVLAMMAAWFVLRETLDARVGRHDRGIELGNKLRDSVKALFSRFRGKKPDRSEYRPLETEDSNTDMEMSQPPSPVVPVKPAPKRRYTQKLPFRRIFTRNVIFTFITHFLNALHLGTFNSIWFVFLSTPVWDPSKPDEYPDALRRNLPFVFTGGLGLKPREVGTAMAILGFIGISLQLFIYPWLSGRLGIMKSFRFFLCFFPVAYFFVPFLSLVPSRDPPPSPKTGAGVWVALALVLTIQVIGRTFALPSQTILVNNCSPHPSVLGTVHGMGASVASFARTVGPVIGGYMFGFGLARGVVGAMWWGLSCVAITAFITSWMVREGDGHEIWLEGDEA